MKRSHLTLTIAVWCISAACFLVVAGYAQYQPRPVDNGQQYWNNYWKFHNQQYRPQQSAAASYPRVSGYNPAPAQKPFSNYRPAPNAYQQYWPLMVYPNTFGGYY